MRTLLLFFSAAAWAALGACGGAADAPARGRPGAGPAASPPEGPADVAVATVNGRPVWGSCVAHQAARGAASRQAALAECIDFELLAQAAEARGLAADAEVGEAARRALVGRLVETGFEARYRTPDDLRDLVDRAVDRYSDQLDQPELRACAFARIEVPKGAPPEADAAARALAEKIAGELAGQAGLFPVDLREQVDRIARGAGQKVTHGDYRPATRERLVPAFADALFAIPEVGRTSPPVRTEWGWDIILLAQLVPAQVHTREEIAAKVFPDVRRQYFQLWVNGIIKSLGVQISIDKDQVARLDAEAGT